MKTLNKTLSLVLVLVMVLGMFGVASAKEFTDSADVKYTEAVDVMTGIGAIDGYTADNTIKPTANISREEAAKLVAYSILGKDVAANLATGATGFSDVDTGRWSAPFISYLVGKGIINGMGDGTFAPMAQVTGYQFAKMMLCAAGYGVNNEYTGSSWQLNVAVDANKLGVYDDATGVDFTKAATREEAMLYAFNGLTKVKQVTYNTVFGGYVAKGSVMNSVDTGDTIAKTLYGNKLTHTPGRNTDGKISAVAYTTGTTTYAATGFDCYGNAADLWTYNNEDVGSYPVEALVSYTKDMTSATDTAAVVKQLNGYTITAVPVVYANQAGTVSSTVSGAEAVAALTGNGKMVNLYANGTTVVRIAVIEEKLAKVTYVDTTKEQITIAIDGTGSTFVTTKGYGTVKLDDYVVVFFTKDAAAKVADVELATVVKGVASSKSTRDETITIDGKAYGAAAGKFVATMIDDFTVSTKGNATLYVDEFGYILKAEQYAAGTEDVIVVTDEYVALDGNKTVRTIEGKNSAGETVTYAVDSTYTTGALVKGDIVKVKDGRESGKYAFDADSSATYGVFTGTAINKAYYASVDIAASNKTVTLGGTPYYYASNVKFIFGDGAPNNKVTVLDGVQEAKASGATNNTFLLAKAGNSYEVVAVFVDGQAKTTATAASDLVYLAAVDGTKVASNGKTYYNYLAVQNGALIADCYGFDLAGNAYGSSSAAYPEGYFYTVSKDADTGAYKFDPVVDYLVDSTTIGAYIGQTGSLQVMIASVVTDLNSANTAVTAQVVDTENFVFVQNTAKTVDMSKATIVNLDKKAMSSGAEIRASYTELMNIATDTTNYTDGRLIVKVPVVGAVLNDKGVASIVYFAEKDMPLAVVRAVLASPKTT